MLIFRNHELIDYMKSQTADIKNHRDFVDLLLRDYINKDNTRRGILLTGLRNTGKTIGAFQVALASGSEQMIYISPVSRNEEVEDTQVVDILKMSKSDVIIIDEFSWIKQTSSPNMLSDYLAGKADGK